MPEPRKRRRWTSISLRGLMILILVVGGLMGWRARRASLQQRAVERIVALGGSATYDWQYPGGGVVGKTPSKTPPGPAWLRRAIGDEYFQDVATVTFPRLFTPIPLIGEDLKAFRDRTAPPGLDAQLACIADLDRLDTLWIYQGQLTHEGLGILEHLVQLKHLTLGPSSIDPDNLDRLGRLTNLESLCVLVEHADVAHLAFLDRLPKLRVLMIQRGPITDAGLAWIARRDQLTTLWVVGSDLTDAGLAPLERMKSLESLQLSMAPAITEEGLAHLTGLVELKMLALGMTHMTDEVLDEFRNLPKLEELHIRGECLSDEAIEKLRADRPRLDVSFFPPRAKSTPKPTSPPDPASR